MNEIFSTKRFGTLLKGTIQSNKHKDIRLVLVMAAIMCFIGFTGFYQRYQYWESPYEMVNFPLALVAIVATFSTFKKLSAQASGISYLTLPASTLEKTVVQIVYMQVYTLLILMVGAMVGAYLGQILHWLCIEFPFHPSTKFWVATPSFKDCGWGLLFTALFQSIALFGSVYFKKLAILKTPLALMGYGLLTAIVWIIESILILDHYEPRGEYEILELSKGASCAIFISINAAVILFCWFMTYLRLRETEA